MPIELNGRGEYSSAYCPEFSDHASTVAGLPPDWALVFFLKIAAEISVMINPTGNGSVKVMAALMKGLSKYFN